MPGARSLFSPSVSTEVTSVIPGTDPTNLGKAEDAPHASSDTGVLLLGVRNANLASIVTSAEGDYSPIAVDANGAVIIGGVFPGVSGLALGKAEDGAHASGDVGVMLLGVRNDTGVARSSADGDYTPLLVDSLGRIAVNGVVPGTAAADIGKAEDAPHASGDTGIMALAVRRDAAAASSGTDGDYEPLTLDNTGRLRIAPAPANSGVDIGDVDVTSVTPGAGAANLGKAEDAVHASGDVGVMLLGVRDDNAPTAFSNADGDYEPLHLDALGRVHIAPLASNSGTDIGDVDVLSVVPGTGATNLGKAEDAPHASGDTGVMLLGVRNESLGSISVSAEGDYSPIAVDQNGLQLIGAVLPGSGALSLGKAEDGAHASGDVGVYMLAVRDDVLAAHSGADNDYESLHTDSIGRLHVTPSNVAHDAVDSENPLKIGMKAIAHGANPTAVAAGDRTDLYANRHGVQFVIGGHPNVITLEAAYTAAQTDTAIITVSAGTKIVVTAVEALCDNANTVDVGVRVGFGAANTPTTTGVVLTHPGIAAGSGVVRGNGSGILGVGADGEDLRITSEAPTTGSLRILVTYYTIES